MEFSCQRFGLDILNIQCNDNIDQNVIYSPISIYMALAMTLSGAQGTTSTQMMDTLYWDRENSKSYHQQLSECMKSLQMGESERSAIRIANKLFLEDQYQLLQSYVQDMSTLYGGSIEKMDFQGHPENSRQDINDWVEQQTDGKITNLLVPGNIHELTKLILVNAIYFKGSWLNKFTIIGDKDFHLLDGSVKSTKMMSKTFHYKYLNNDQLQFSAVQVPFKTIQNDVEYSLMIILPRDKNGLAHLEKSLVTHQWKSVLSDELFQHSSVSITMPKFRIECSFHLEEHLGKLGMVLPFSKEADFSLMTGHRGLLIDKVIHKAFIDIDENGAEAAAATAIMMMTGCAAPSKVEPIEFNCDHPFMFAIIKDGSLPLFVGHLTKI